ncbi:hypothetical protein NDU88_001492 [Pleurodeles waltl]|uniref:Uncharacterized protein n=1 Tax=Pleurodeles waltl TaxID=8319 RepID=A0AAV7TI01_PLEWA|nr:hypothetical protein NDU88_001492 [Pleurodeles waltl]
MLGPGAPVRFLPDIACSQNVEAWQAGEPVTLVNRKERGEELSGRCRSLLCKRVCGSKDKQFIRPSVPAVIELPMSVDTLSTLNQPRHLLLLLIELERAVLP